MKSKKEGVMSLPDVGECTRSHLKQDPYFGKKVAVIGGLWLEKSPVFGKTWEYRHTQHRTVLGDGCVEYKEKGGVIFIPRQGYQNRRASSLAEYSANVIAARMLGASVVIGTCAVESLQGFIGLEALVVPEDLVDESGAYETIFAHGIAVSPDPTPPFSSALRELLVEASERVPFAQKVPSGVYFSPQGQRRLTNAEAKRHEKYAIVGPTASEALIALEAGLHYAFAGFTVGKAGGCSPEAVMRKSKENMMQKGLIPDYLEALVTRAKEYAAQPELLPQLVGRVVHAEQVAGATEREKNAVLAGRMKTVGLRLIAEHLLHHYGPGSDLDEVSQKRSTDKSAPDSGPAVARRVS